MKRTTAVAVAAVIVLSAIALAFRKDYDLVKEGIRQLSSSSKHGIGLRLSEISSEVGLIASKDEVVAHAPGHDDEKQAQMDEYACSSVIRTDSSTGC